MATITTQFAPGDTVFVVVSQKEASHATCEFCSSTGEVTLSGQQFKCPACGGRMASSGERVPSVAAMIVATVRAGKCTQNCRIVYEGEVSGKKVSRVEAEVFATEQLALASIAGG